MRLQFVGMFLLLSCSLANANNQMKLWYEQPAAKWTEALPVGNGRLGAMVFGGVQQEHIQLNEESIWAGPPVPVTKPGFKDAMEKARGLWFEGKYVEAESLVQHHMAPRINPRSYQTLGDLHIELMDS